MKKNSTIIPALEEEIADDVAGLPTSNEKWVRKSLRKLAASLRKRGHSISRMTVRRLLKDLNLGLVSNQKSILKENHPDRDKQFRYIKRLKHWALGAGIPTISVDAKNKELIGRIMPTKGVSGLKKQRR